MLQCRFARNVTVTVQEFEIEEKQTNRRLLFFKVSGFTISVANYGHVMLWRRPSRNVTVTVQEVETLKEIGRRLARFSLKVHCGAIREKSRIIAIPRSVLAL